MATELHEPENAPVDVVEERHLAGLLAEFDNVDSVMKAARTVRDAGFQRWDVHSPFPMHGIDNAMGIRPTILPWLVLGAGLTGLTVGAVLIWYTNAFEYPFYASGKTLLSVPTWIPVMFELTILFSALTAVFGMIGLNALPQLYNPLFKIDRFRRATADRFFVVIDATDPRFDEEQVTQMLKGLNPSAIERVED
jgi:hypothetical protein